MSSDPEDDTDVYDYNDEELDPRIRDKLEELNKCTENINKLEKHFEELNALFRNTLNEKAVKLRKIALKLGKSVSESRPYYECRTRVTELQKKCQMAVQAYERSAELHSQSKQTITIAESKFAANKESGSDFDNFWQDLLNQANTKFMEAKNMKNESQSEHCIYIQNYFDEQKRLFLLEKRLRSAIKKSKPYYEESDNVQKELNNIKQEIERLNLVILEAKQTYAKTLKDLENISEEIHERRAQMLAKKFKREPGVGAEYEIENHTSIEIHESSQEVPQIDINQINVEFHKTSANDLQVKASPQSPNCSLDSRSPSGLSSSSSFNLTVTEDSPPQLAQAFIDCDNTEESAVKVDTNGNSLDDTNDNQILKSFDEIDLGN